MSEQEYIFKLMKRLNFNEQDALELNVFLSKMEQRIRADERKRMLNEHVGTASYASRETKAKPWLALLVMQAGKQKPYHD